MYSNYMCCGHWVSIRFWTTIYSIKVGDYCKLSKITSVNVEKGVPGSDMSR